MSRGRELYQYWTVTDACGNVSAAYTQVITIIDTQAPVWTTAVNFLNRTVQCSDAAGIAAAQALFPAATDNCDTDVTNIVKTAGAFVAGTCPEAGSYTNTWTVTDACGNVSAAYTQVITIIDTQAPTFTRPPDDVICRNADCSFDISPGITGDVNDENDNCSTNLNATYLDDASGAADCDKAGIILRTWSLIDHCGNAAANQIQIIRVNPIPSISVLQSDAILCYTGGSVNFDINTSNTVVPGSQWRYDVEITYPSDVTGIHGGPDGTVIITDLTATGIASFTDDLFNNGDNVKTVIYRFIPHILPGDGGAECGNGIPIIRTVEINPQPKVTVNTDQVICYDGDAIIDISTANTSVSSGGQWRYDVSPVTYPVGVTGDWASGLPDQTATGIAALTDNLVNNTSDVQTVTYTFTPHIRPGDGGAECTDGVPVTVTVNINPRPRIAVITDAELCYDNPASV